MRDAVRGYDAAMRDMPTPELTRVLERRSKRISRRWCAAGASSCATPTRAGAIRRAIVIHGNQTASVPDAYRRYLVNVYREAFDLFATPVAIEFRSDENPYDRLRAGKVKPRTAARTMPGRQRRG